ncbi:MAG: hypothetical protein ACTHL5_10730 [Rhodanobacter sp.]
MSAVRFRPRPPVISRACRDAGPFSFSILSPGARPVPAPHLQGRLDWRASWAWVLLPEHPHSRRLVHVHCNMSGALSRINALFSAGDININAQFLQTYAKVGYVVIEVAADVAQTQVLKERTAAPGTLKTRVLH